MSFFTKPTLNSLCLWASEALFLKKKKKKTFQIVNRAVCREGRNISDNEYVSWYRHSDAGGLFPSLSLSYVSILSPWGQWGHFGLLSITPSTISLPFLWSPQIWGPAHAHTLWSSTAPGALGSLQVFLLWLWPFLGDLNIHENLNFNVLVSHFLDLLSKDFTPETMLLLLLLSRVSRVRLCATS